LLAQTCGLSHHVEALMKKHVLMSVVRVFETFGGLK
jgi:hypothetical protein